MTDILITHSYFLKYDEKEYHSMMPYPPLGTLYAATRLKEQGFSVACFDSMLADNETDLLPLLDLHTPSFLLIYDDDFNYLTKMCLSKMRDAVFAMSRMAKERGCTVIVHGSDPADHAESYIYHGADYVVIGEGEITICELINHLRGAEKPTLAEIKGIAYNYNGSVQRNPQRAVLQDLDCLSFPERDLVDIQQYKTLWRKRHGYFSMNIVTTRGCPFHCNWCAKPIYGQVYHSRSPENVVEEMILLNNNYHPDHLWFCDDIFGLKPGWVEKFADTIQKMNAGIPFKCLSRADLILKDNTAEHLSRAGCQTVWIGAESGSQKILDAMEKGTTVKQIYESTALLRRNGIRVGFFLQYGYPGETKSDIESTLQMIKDCRPDEIGVSVSYPLPGTKFYENVRQHLGEKQNWVDSRDLALMFRGTYVPDFYRTLHKITHKKFRLWQGRELINQMATQPWSISKKNIRGLIAMAYHAATLPLLETQLHRLESIPRDVS
jgi:radical SAM superfamily enzyme YgiQ (UPF0313 family)